MSTLYKAMTRPAMYVGVPVVPLTVVAGALFLSALAINRSIFIKIKYSSLFLILKG